MKFLKMLGVVLFPFVFVGIEIRKESSKIKGFLVGLLAFFIFAGFWGGILGTETETKTKTEPNLKETLKWQTLAVERGRKIEELENTIEQEKSDKRLATTKKPKKPETYTLGSGNYLVGTDIKPGTYNLEALKGGGNVQTENGDLNAIMGVGDDFYDKTYKNVKLVKGDTLIIKMVTIKLNEVIR